MKNVFDLSLRRNVLREPHCPAIRHLKTGDFSYLRETIKPPLRSAESAAIKLNYFENNVDYCQNFEKIYDEKVGALPRGIFIKYQLTIWRNKMPPKAQLRSNRNGSNGNAKGVLDLENSARIFQPKREKVEFSLAVDVIGIIESFELFLQQMKNCNELLQSGTVKEIFF